jgi:hypothetical protein
MKGYCVLELNALFLLLDPILGRLISQRIETSVCDANWFEHGIGGVSVYGRTNDVALQPMKRRDRRYVTSTLPGIRNLRQTPSGPLFPNEPILIEGVFRMTSNNAVILLKAQTYGAIKKGETLVYKERQYEFPEPGSGELIVKALYLSADPYLVDPPLVLLEANRVERKNQR